MKSIKKIIICFIFFNVISTPLYSGLVSMWTQRYDSGNNDKAYEIALDSFGNVYVTGSAVIGGNDDYCTIKYDNNGNSIWTQEYDGSGNSDIAWSIAVDLFEYVYVTGQATLGGDSDCCTIKYSNNGIAIWTQVYDSGVGNSDAGRGVVVDSSGYVYVAGVKDHFGANGNYITIKYDNNGNSIWTQEYNSSGANHDLARGIAMDNSGYFYVTGVKNYNTASADYVTIKYYTNGTSIWTQEYNGGDNDEAYGITADDSGNVYVTGSKKSGANYDYCTIKYDTDGTLLWKQEYDGNGVQDIGWSIAVDYLGYVYVTGQSTLGGDKDYCTIKYDNNGNSIWTQEYDGGNEDEAYGIAVDNSGYVYVTGGKYNGADWDYFTIKYLQPPYPDPTSLSGSFPGVDSINLTWQDNTINESGFKIERSYNGVNYSVIGKMPKNTFQFHDTSISQQTTYWYRVTATNAAGESAFTSVMITRPPIYSLDNIVLVPNPFNPNKSPKNYITFFNCPDDVTIKIYDILGDKLKELVSPNAEHKIIWDVKDSNGTHLSRGMYMAILKDNQGEKRTIKFLIHR